MTPLISHQDHYAVYKLYDTGLLETLTSIFYSSLYNSCDSSISGLHQTITQKELNNYRIARFNEINSIPNLKELLYLATYPALCSSIGPDLAIQNKLNLSIQLPHDSTSLLPKHVDSRSGDSPFQRVIWIPLCNSYGSNTIHIECPLTHEYLPINVDVGSFLVFDPNIPHGNVINNTPDTRVSVNIRVKNWFTPDNPLCPDRQFGIYYEDFVFTSSTLRAFDIHRRFLSQP
jgi:hypothetical protein